MRLPLIAAILIIPVIFTPTSSPVPVAHAAPPYTITWAEKHVAPYAVGQAGVIGGLDGKVYVMGGFAGSSPFSTAIAYDPSSDSWSNLAGMPVPTRGPGIARDSNGLIYVLSGFSGSGDLINNQVYNPANNSWTTGTNVPTPVWMPGAATGSDGRIYLIGGESGAGTALTTVQIYSPQSGVWTTGTSMTTGRKQFSIVAAPNGLIYAVGGYTTSGATAAVEAYNITSNTWTAKSSLPSAVMEYGSALGPDGLIYIFGGSTNYTNDNAPFFSLVYSYDPIADTWYNNTQTLPIARKELGATTALNHRIYTIGGGNGTYLAVNEEATLPSTPPVATISSITPSPAQVGQTVTFTGTGASTSGTIIAYAWQSSISGSIGTQASFSTNSLPAGTHTISFSVEDNLGNWSPAATATLTVGSGAQPAAYTTMIWLGLAAVIAAVGVVLYIFMASKKRKDSGNAPLAPPASPPGLGSPAGGQH